MKKVLFMISVATFTLMGCTNESSEYVGSGPEQKEIAFMPITQKATRAAVQGTAFPDQSMEVAAYQSAGIATPANYFAKTTFSKDGSTGTWKGSRYWPLSSATINFFAVTGEATNKITIQNDLSSASVTYATNNQYDIMYAFGRGAVEQNGNALVFPANVPMAFKHALALINFQIKGSTAIKLKSITIDNAYYTGSLDLANTGANAASGDVTTTVTWTPDGSEGSYTVPNIGNRALTDSYYPTNSNTETATDWANVMIIPTQQAGSSTSYGFKTFTITYCIVNNGVDGPEQTYTYAPSGYTDATPNLTAVAAGTKYTYQINMTLHEIEIVPSVTAWTDGGSSYVNIPTTTIAYDAASPTFTATTAGTYSFTITGVPAHGESTYSVVAADSGDDIITSVTKVRDTTPASGEEKGTITVNVKLKSTTGTKAIKLKLGDSDMMTINVTRS